jgi:hypothetical protein
VKEKKCVYCSIEAEERASVFDDVDWFICEKHYERVEQKKEPKKLF